MSEPASLYVRVAISRRAFEQFLTSPAAKPSDFDDWGAWLRARGYSSWVEPGQIDAQAVHSTAGMQLSSLYGASGARSGYDPATERWQLVVLDFSENVYEYAATLALLRGLAVFKDRPEPGFALIFGYFWDHYVAAHLRIGCGQTALAAEAPEDDLMEARAELKALYDDVREGFDLNAL